LLWFAAAADLVFMLALGFAIARPVLQVRQWRQAPVLLVLLLLTAGNLLFYLSAAGGLPSGVRIGVHGGLYLVLGMVLFMGSRVIPFFTERGVGYEVELKKPRWNDHASAALFPLFLLSEMILPQHILGALLAAGLMVLNSMRVSGWYTLGIWRKPLLWGLFVAFIMINFGFLLRALMPVTAIPDFLPIHAYAVGGIGVVTLAMMARVSLGHTGRSVQQAPGVVTPMLLGIVLAAVLRVFAPLADPAHYALWVALSGLVWIGSFALFALVFIPMLVRPRPETPT
ncbi:MAG: NnrS family protein, partial [Lysobacterales bacterium]